MKKTRTFVVDFVRQRMKAAGLKQAELARMADIEKGHLNRILSGKRGMGPEVEIRIAKALGCTVEELYIDPSKIETKPPTMTMSELAGIKPISEERMEAIVAHAVQAALKAKEAEDNQKKVTLSELAKTDTASKRDKLLSALREADDDTIEMIAGTFPELLAGSKKSRNHV